MAEPTCGSTPCTAFVDRLGATMTEQQKAGIAAIKEIMQVHHSEIKEDIAELKSTIKYQGDEIFPRLRDVEETLKVMQATTLSEKQVREMVAANETVKWTSGRRSFERAVAKVVVAATVLAVLTAGIAMYVDHQNQKSSATVTQPRR